jgi:phosphatidylglycerophosphate synthase
MSAEPLPPYVYKCEDHSLLVDHYRRWIVPLWWWWVPRWMPANIITLGSSACMWAVFVLSLQANGWGPNTQVLVFLLLTQVYLGYDHVDGMQAKRTGTSSALGEYLDHSLDVYHGAIVVIASCALLPALPLWAVMIAVWSTLVAFSVTMVEEKERGELYFGLLGPVEAMAVSNSFFLSCLIPAVREWWMAPLVLRMPPYVIVASLSMHGTALDCLRRIRRVPLSFAVYFAMSLLLAVLLAIHGGGRGFALAALLLHSGDYGGRVIGSHLLRRPEAWPDFVGPALAGVCLLSAPWLRIVLLLWLGFHAAWSFIGVVWPLRADWRWVNPSAKPA